MLQKKVTEAFVVGLLYHAAEKMLASCSECLDFEF
jgi:hypothetical protein